MRSLFIFAVIIFSVSACAPVPRVQEADMTPVQNLILNEKTSSKTNYKLGEVKNVFVGDQIIKKKVEKIKTQSRLVAIPMMNISLVSDRIKLILFEGKPYTIEYQVRRENMPFRVVNIQNTEISDSNEVYGVMFDNNGIVYNKILDQGNEVKKPVNIVPINAAVKVSSIEEEIGRETVEDYEITYAGMANGEIRLLYKENAGDSPGLTQELTYPADSPSIRFKTIQIKLHKVTAESLIYEVEGQ